MCSCFPNRYSIGSIRISIFIIPLYTSKGYPYMTIFGTHPKQSKLSWLVIFVAVLGIIPLAYLGLITPSQQVAFLIGLTDVSLAIITFIEAIRIGMLADNKD